MADNQVPKSAWLVRGGGSGEYEEQSLEQSILLLGFQEIPDLSDADTLDEVKHLLREQIPGHKEGFYGNVGRQMFSFRHTIAIGDLVATPLKHQEGQVRLGIVRSSYKFKPIEDSDDHNRHFRRVEWLEPVLDKRSLAVDLQKSLNVPPTIAPIRAEDAVERLLQVRSGSPDPGLASGLADTGILSELPIAEDPHEQIKDYVATHFRDHRFAELVEAILSADGYTTKLSPPGADEGIDVFASRGKLGLEQPHICVQVKMTKGAIGAPEVRALQGSVRTYHANQGLFVSWSGFTDPARREARQAHFNLRLWTADDLVEALYRTYEQLPHAIRSQLPLQQVWVLVLEEENS